LSECTLIVLYIIIILAFTLTFIFFFFTSPSITKIYTLSLHDALPISVHPVRELLLAVDRTDPVPDRGLPLPTAEAGGDPRIRRPDREGREAQDHGGRDGSPRLRGGRGHAARREFPPGRGVARCDDRS